MSGQDNGKPDIEDLRGDVHDRRGALECLHPASISEEITDRRLEAPGRFPAKQAVDRGAYFCRFRLGPYRAAHPIAGLEKLYGHPFADEAASPGDDDQISHRVLPW